MGIFENQRGDKISLITPSFRSTECSKIIGEDMKKVTELIDIRLYENKRYLELETTGQASCIDPSG